MILARDEALERTQEQWGMIKDAGLREDGST